MITNFNTNLLVVSFEFVRKNGAVLTGSSTYLKLLIIHLITKTHDWVLKFTFANIVFLFVRSIRHLLL